MWIMPLLGFPGGQEQQSRDAVITTKELWECLFDYSMRRSLSSSLISVRRSLFVIFRPFSHYTLGYVSLALRL